MILLIHINKMKPKTKLNFSVVPGPPDWHKKWEQCGYSQQSPINTDKSEAEHTDFPTLKIIFDNPGGLVTGTLKNNGHNPTLEIDEDKGTGTLEGGAVDGTYTLEQFHVHFGCENNRGSEHTESGKRYSGQVMGFFVKSSPILKCSRSWRCPFIFPSYFENV